MLPPGTSADGSPNGNTFGRFHKGTVSYVPLIRSTIIYIKFFPAPKITTGTVPTRLPAGCRGRRHFPQKHFRKSSLPPKPPSIPRTGKISLRILNKEAKEI